MQPHTSQNSSVSTVTMLWPRHPRTCGLRIPGQDQTFNYISNSLEQRVGPTRGTSPPAVSKPGHKAHHSLPSSSKINSEWSLPLLPPHAVMAQVRMSVYCHVTVTACCPTVVPDHKSKHSLSLINNKLSLPNNMQNCNCSTTVSTRYSYCTAIFVL
jgi:hypothetical protein